MAKRNMINREHKRIALVAKYAKRRAALKATISSVNATPEERFAAVEALQKQLSCNAMAVPRISKITLNMGVGEATADK